MTTISIREAAQALDVPTVTIRKWISRRQFATTQRGRVTTRDLAALACGLQLRQHGQSMDAASNAMRVIQRCDTLDADIAAGRDSLLIANGQVHDRLVSRAELVATCVIGRPDLLGSKSVVLADVKTAVQRATLAMRVIERNRAAEAKSSQVS